MPVDVYTCFYTCMHVRAYKIYVMFVASPMCIMYTFMYNVCNVCMYTSRA